MEISPLLDEMHGLQDRCRDSSLFVRQALDLAASLLEYVYEGEVGRSPERITRLSPEEYFELPDRFELVDGRISPKEWGYWPIFYRDKPENGLG